MPQGPRLLRLLVVDDRDQLRELIADLLATDERFGTTVLRASNGAEAIEVARRERPDAVLLDNSMPVLTGLDALPELRRLLHRAVHRRPRPGGTGPRARRHRGRVQGALRSRRRRRPGRRLLDDRFQGVSVVVGQE
jgi:hypothetical protein